MRRNMNAGSGSRLPYRPLTPQRVRRPTSDAGVLNLTVAEAAVRNADGAAIRFDVLRGSTSGALALPGHQQAGWRRARRQDA
jgi:hypothetical protein